MSGDKVEEWLLGIDDVVLNPECLVVAWNGMAWGSKLNIPRERGKATESCLKACHAGLFNALLMRWRPVCVGHQWLKQGGAEGGAPKHPSSRSLVVVYHSCVEIKEEKIARSEEEDSLNSTADGNSIPSFEFIQAVILSFLIHWRSKTTILN